MSRIKYGEEILRIIDDLETASSTNVLSLIKKINRETRQELGIDIKAFFSNPTIIEKLIKIGQKHEDDDRILEEIIKTVTNISWRFEVKTQNLYDFLVKHIESKNNKIKFAIASCVPYFSQFNNYNKKWEYVLSIPKIPPKKESIRLFRWVIEEQIDEIPSDLKENIVTIMEDYIDKVNLDITTYKNYVDIVEQLKNTDGSK